MTTKFYTGTQSWSPFLSGKQRQKGKRQTHKQVQNSGFCDSTRLKRNHFGKRMRQILAEMVWDWKAIAGFKIEAQCKGVVASDGMSSLIIVAEIANVRRSRVVTWGILVFLCFFPVINRYIFDIFIDICREPCRHSTSTFADIWIDICIHPYRRAARIPSLVTRLSGMQRARPYVTQYKEDKSDGFLWNPSQQKAQGEQHQPRLVPPPNHMYMSFPTSYPRFLNCFSAGVSPSFVFGFLVSGGFERLACM